jgi:hypothetical protein
MAFLVAGENAVNHQTRESVRIEIRLTWGTEAIDARWRTGHSA